MTSDPVTLLGRAPLIAAIEARLTAGGGVALHGPGGIGRTAVLDAVATAAVARGELVPRLRPVCTELRLAYAGIADLLNQLPPDAAAGLPRAQRAAHAALRQGLAPRAGTPALARRLVLPLLLARCAQLLRRPVLIVIDDAQWLDPESAALIGFAMRRRPGPRIRVLAAQRLPAPDAAGGPHRAARLCPAPVAELPVPPLAVDDLTALLEAHGLPCRTAYRLHEATGGNPFLALALGGATAPGPVWRPAPLPGPARELLRERIAALPADVAETLTVAALATEPTVGLLVRAGRADAGRDLRTAAAQGMVALDGDAVRFTPPLLGPVLADDADAAARARVHGELAVAALDEIGAARHRALTGGRPDAVKARELAAAADRAAASGAGHAAAELALLAADRAPAELAAERLDWLVTAARTAATAGSPELAGRAAEAVLAAPGAGAGHRVPARLVLIDLAGQALAGMEETFAAALVEAGPDAGLAAPVRLRLAWAALLAGDLDTAAAEADRTVTAARAARDPTVEALALTALAQVRRLRGDPRWTAILDRALALPARVPPGLLNQGPRYVAARFAMVDDRLDEARTALLTLLAVAEHDRSGEALVEVLRSLSEVATRAGRCRDALGYAHRAVTAAQRAGLSPGPTWYTAAVAELAGGSLTAAARYAHRGVRASEQDGDVLYLRRNLHALGQAELRTGDTRDGVSTLRRLRDLESSGTGDPMIVRWQGDLAGGLAALGEHAEAAAMLAEARAAARRLGSGPGIAGYLDRAAAVVLSESGQADTAVLLSAAAAHHFAELHQPIEQGHALLVQGGAERRRRRYAAARVAIGAALALFLQADAKPWMEQTERALARADGSAASGGPAPDLGLTSTETRIAGLVRDGASNREIATQLFVSVKTVEATLTRVYRKLGVRSRTQLSLRLAGLDPGAGPSTRVFPVSMTAVDA